MRYGWAFLAYLFKLNNKIISTESGTIYLRLIITIMTCGRIMRLSWWQIQNEIWKTCSTIESIKTKCISRRWCAKRVVQEGDAKYTRVEYQELLLYHNKGQKMRYGDLKVLWNLLRYSTATQIWSFVGIFFDFLYAKEIWRFLDTSWIFYVPQRFEGSLESASIFDICHKDLNILWYLRYSMCHIDF